MLFCAQFKNSKTKVRLHTRHYCTQVALHTWYYCLQIDCLHAILRTIQKLRQTGTFAHTNQLPTVSFAHIPFADGSFTYKNFCLQFDCLQALFRTIKNFQNGGTFAHTTQLHTSRIAHMILLPTDRLPTCYFTHISKIQKRKYVCILGTIAHKSHCAHDVIGYRSKVCKHCYTH